MNRTRQTVDHRRAGAVLDAPRLLPRGLVIRTAVLAILLLHCSTVPGQMPTGRIQGVYATQVRPGQPVLYGILQQLPSPPPQVAVPEAWRDGVLLRVMITAGPAARTRPVSVACRQCTAQHFFLLPSEFPPGAQRKLRALRHPPGRVTYLEVKGQEYALFHIRALRTDDGFRLTAATLMRTGFVPPILKKRLRLRFDTPLPDGTRKDGIVAEALAETRESTPGGR